jgi:GT2 family glycosyltransferase
LPRLPKVSAIVVNWNGMEFLPTCLDSIFKQSYKNLEVIVVDCASKDESVSCIAENYPKTKVIVLQKDPGPPSAINLAARQAEGEYILILNNDVILPKDMITKMIEEMKKDENCVINPVELDWERKYRQAGCTDPWLARHLSKFIKITGDAPSYPSTACCLVSKKLFLDTPLNENLFIYEDTEWGWRLHLNGVKNKVLLSSFFLHKCGATLGNSAKRTFLQGRTPLATFFICFKLSTLSVLLPYLLITYYLSPKRIAYFFVKGWLGSFLMGILSFFEKLSLFIQDRRKSQKDRKIADMELLKIIIGSISFQETAKQEWERLYAKK